MMAGRKRGRPDDWEELTPSPVIHIRELPEHTLEVDLMRSFEKFGSIRDVSMIPNKGQALVEFNDISAAELIVSRSQSEAIYVANRRVKVNFSTSLRIVHRHGVAEGGGENTVLLLTVYNAQYPITVDVIKQICSPHGRVLRIVIFRKGQVQAMVEFDTLEDSRRAKKNLNGADIYSGCCTLKVEYARPSTLTVMRNDQDSWDYDPSTGIMDQRHAGNSLLGTPEGRGSLLMPNMGGGYNDMPPGPPMHHHMDSDRGMPLMHGGSGGRSMGGRGGDRNGDYGGGRSGGGSMASRSGLLFLAGDDRDMDGGGRGGMGQSGHRNMNGGDRWSGGGGGGGGGGFRGGRDGGMHQGMGGVSASMSGGDMQAMGQSGTCVAMVYGFNMDRINCDRVFNVFCLYGNVVRVKFLHSKAGAAMVQMGDGVSVDRLIAHLNGARLFDSKLEIQPSKQQVIMDVPQPYLLPDETPSFKDFTGSRNNRWINTEMANKNKVSQPSRTLHYWNFPPNKEEEDIQKILDTAGCVEPECVLVFDHKGKSSSSGLIEWNNKNDALDTLALVNHTSVPHVEGKYPYLLKLSFSHAPIKERLARGSKQH